MITASGRVQAIFSIIHELEDMPLDKALPDAEYTLALLCKYVTDLYKRTTGRAYDHRDWL